MEEKSMCNAYYEGEEAFINVRRSVTTRLDTPMALFFGGRLLWHACLL